MKFIINHHGEEIKFENGFECHIFDCVTNFISDTKEALKCTQLVVDCYLKDNNYTPLGHLSDYIAQRWDKGIRNLSRSEILEDFYINLY